MNCLRIFFLYLLFLIIIPINKTSAQNNDSLKNYHSPKKAAILSAVIPGMGQAYNKKYWKIPIIYGGFGGLIYAIDFNQRKYQTYRKAYILRTDKDAATIDDFIKIYTDDNLRVLRDYYRRNRDLTYILTTGFYLLYIIDANVDAHLFDFDISDNLSLNISPLFSTFQANNLLPNFYLILKF